MGKQGGMEIGGGKGRAVRDGGVEEMLNAPYSGGCGGRGPWRKLFGDGADVGP